MHSGSSKRVHGLKGQQSMTTPDFVALKKNLTGSSNPDRVHFVEMFDREIIAYILRNRYNVDIPYREADREKQKKIAAFRNGQRVCLSTESQEIAAIEREIEFYSRMGYDYYPDFFPNQHLKAMLAPKGRFTEDTAPLQKLGGHQPTAGFDTPAGTRCWTEEETGLITSREEFERFPWEKMSLELDNHFDLLERILPKGMKTMIGFSYWEYLQDQFLGYQGLCYLIHDDPVLVRKLADIWGQIILDHYAMAIRRPFVGGIFHADDFGHKSGTTISPASLRSIFFPWIKKFASLAHQYNKMFWLHACGNLQDVMDDLIDYVEIDAFHSFQDAIVPVTSFKKKYGDRIAVLGGVDMDKLIRFNETELRDYVRKILDVCMDGGRYALGSANTIANFVPIENYLIMMDEGRNWKIR